MATFATAEHAQLASLMRNWETHNALRHHPTQVSVPPRLLVKRCFDRESDDDGRTPSQRPTCAAFKLLWIEYGSDARVLAEWLHLIQLAARAGATVLRLLYAPYACWHTRHDCAFCECDDRRVFVELQCARINARTTTKITQWNSASVLHAVLTRWQGEEDPAASPQFKQVCQAIRAMAPRLSPALPIHINVVLSLQTDASTLPHGDVIALRNSVGSNQQELVELSAFTVAVGKTSIPRVHIDDMVNDLLLGETPVQFRALVDHSYDWKWLLDSTSVREMVEQGWLQLSLRELRLVSREVNTHRLVQMCEALRSFTSLKELHLHWAIAAAQDGDNGIKHLERVLFSDDSKLRLDVLLLHLTEDGCDESFFLQSSPKTPLTAVKQRQPLRHKKIELWVDCISSETTSTLLENTARFPPESLSVVGDRLITCSTLESVLATQTSVRSLTLNGVEREPNTGTLLELALLCGRIERSVFGSRDPGVPWSRLRTLNLHFQKAKISSDEDSKQALDSILEVVGINLTELTLSDDAGALSARAAGTIVDNCPRLQSLSVSGLAVGFVSTLVVSYDSRHCSMQTLTLGLTTVESKKEVARLFYELTQESRRIGQVVQEVRITELALNPKGPGRTRTYHVKKTEATKRAFTQAAFSVLAANPRIRLVLEPLDPLEAWPGAPVRHRYAMQLVPTLLSRRLALLSVLRQRDLELPRDVVEIIWLFLMRRVPRVW
ncbi:hypothetical protein PINS_up010579 [Pythium insidiosum]|nr:hypothetical protein PINS_up010579 [Pythium insidiosum]